MVMLVIGQCNRTVKGTVHTSCLSISGQDTSCMHTVVSYFIKLMFFFRKTCKRCLVSFVNFDMVLINC